MPPVITPAPAETRYLVKRDGSKELVDVSKLIKWTEWAAQHIKGPVPWTRIAGEVLHELQDGMTTVKLHNTLIDRFIAEGTWNCNRMAGILWAPMLQKSYYPDGIPTVQALHKDLAERGLMRSLPYTDDEYEQIEKLIDHDIDFTYAHFQLKQLTTKYSLSDLVSKKKFETPQFVFMRMAMALSEHVTPASKRMKYVEDIYDILNRNVVNAPTPNYLYLGTKMNGLVSCCLYKTDDNIPSLSTGNVIAYRMTAIGAGIGGFLEARGLGEGIRGGSILHNGKLPYYKSKASNVKANMQSGRAGAATSYYNIFDREATAIAQLQNPRTPEAQRNRDMHFAVQYHPLFLQKALNNEQVFTFSSKTAPDLFAAFYSSDRGLFEKLYDKYDRDPEFKKNYVDARELLIMTSRQGPEVGTHYEFHTFNANYNTPFIDPIFSSNLCVAPETKILTREGEVEIQSKAGQKVDIWNGEEWSEVDVVKTGINQPLLKVTTSSGNILNCTPYHKWYVTVLGSISEVRTHELKAGMELIHFVTPEGKSVQGVTVTSIEDTGRKDDTYCFTEHKRHMGVFNGILTGQCVEIFEPTWGFKDESELFEADYLYDVTFEDTEGNQHTMAQRQQVLVNNDGVLINRKAYFVQVGDKVQRLDENQTFDEFTVAKIVDKPRQPEVALCSLAGIVLPNVKDDEDYYKAMFYAQHMIDYCIHQSDYPFEQIAFTAKNRLNAGIGALGPATVMAREGVRFDSVEGLNLSHRLAERHMYFAIKASIAHGKEKGNAPWIDRTKWPKGWLPIDTCSDQIKTFCTQELVYDWEELRRELILNKGMRFSCLVAHMPTESSSKAAGVPNGLYPIRELSLAKTDSGSTVDWVAMESDLIGPKYQLAYSIEMQAMLRYYSVWQKFTDQGISADTYIDRSQTLDLSATELILTAARASALGLKGRYYVNSKTDGNTDIMSKDVGCSSGACTL